MVLRSGFLRLFTLACLSSSSFLSNTSFDGQVQNRGRLCNGLGLDFSLWRLGGSGQPPSVHVGLPSPHRNTSGRITAVRLRIPARIADRSQREGSMGDEVAVLVDAAGLAIQYPQAFDGG